MAFNTIALLIIFLAAAPFFLESEAVPVRQVEPNANPKRNEKNPTLTSICQKTFFFDECITTLKPVLKKSHVSPTAALYAEINIAFAKFQQTKKLADEIANEVGTPVVMKQCLSECSDNFYAGINGLIDTFKAIREHDHDSLISVLGEVITFTEKCNDAFAEARMKSSISDASLLLGKISSNCYKIAEQVHL